MMARRSWLILALTLATSCSREPDRVHAFTGPTMGSTYELKVAGSSASAATARAVVERELRSCDQTFSTWRDDSEIAKVNAHRSTASMQISERFAAVLDTALLVAAATNGAFDPTVKPLSDLYRAAKADPSTPLALEASASAAERVGFRMVTISRDIGGVFLQKSRPDVELDLDGIVAGAAADAIAVHLESVGVTDFYLQITGEVLWTIGWPEASGIYENAGQYAPTAVAVAPDGRIYIGDGYGKSWVHCYDKDRNYVKSFGGPGGDPGKMRTPHGLWMDTRGDEPLLLVCDRENHRLQWFTLDGAFVRMTTKDLRRPCNVWPMPDGGLVVADLVGRISFLDKSDAVYGHIGDNPDPKLRARNGVPRAQWKDGEFLSPHSVCVDKLGNVYVMDWNSLGRITRLTLAPRAGEEGSQPERGR